MLGVGDQGLSPETGTCHLLPLVEDKPGLPCLGSLRPGRVWGFQAGRDKIGGDRALTLSTGVL